MSVGRRTFGARAAALGVLLGAFGALVACGQRGPLTLPGAETPAESPATSSTTEPAASEPRAEDDDEPLENER